MDEIKKAELAIKQLKDFIELRRASAKMTISEHKEQLTAMANDAMCVVRDISVGIVGKGE